MANDHKQVRHCGNSRSPLRAELCRIPRKSVLIFLHLGSWPFAEEETKRAILAGAKLWSDVVDLEFSFTTTRDDAHITMQFTRIDRPGNVLADMQLPCPFRPPLRGRFDSSETWGESAPPLGSAISLPSTAAHELGHALGIGHGPSESIMFRLIRSDVNRLGRWDKQQALLRYPAKTNGNGDLPMSDLFRCLIAALPAFFACITSGQADADKENREGPIDAIGKLAAAYLESKRE